MVTHEQAAIWGNFWQIFHLSKMLISDYENIPTKQELLKNLPQIETAYIDSIIVHVAKIFTRSDNEPFSLAKFKTLCRDEIRKEIEGVEGEYKDIIGKIITNRNRLIAHLDKTFYELYFSKSEIERMEQAMSTGMGMSLNDAKSIYASMPRTADKSKERYSFGDFREDFPRIKAMIDKLEDIWGRSMPFVESGVRATERNASAFLSLSLRFAKEYLKQLKALRKIHGEAEIQELNELTVHHRALWTALIVEIRKLFGASFKGYKNYSLREIDFFKNEPHKTKIDTVYGNHIIQRILKTSNNFTVHLSQEQEVPLDIVQICNSNLEDLLTQLQEPMEAFRNTLEPEGV